jgi:hypothetical protein
VRFEASSSRHGKAPTGPTFGIEPQDHTRQFAQASGFEEVGGEPRGEYPSCHGNAESVEHFL